MAAGAKGAAGGRGGGADDGAVGITRMGARIRARRIDRGLKQADLAAAAGISAPYLNLIEHDRRRIGGRLLLALARVLAVEPSVLSEGVEAGLVAALGAVTASATPGAPRPQAAAAVDLAARFPDWAGLVVAQHRRIALLEERIEGLADRLGHDPRLAAALHEVLSVVTAIRSTAAILNEQGELPREWLTRFHGNIDADARRLALASRELVAYLEGEAETVPHQGGTLTPQEELERWLAGGGEEPAGPEAARLAEDWRRQAARDAEAVPDAALDGGDAFAVAAATGAPLAAVFRRLSARPGHGLVVADASGAILFRRAAPGFQLPRLGAACPLWPLFRALSRPMQPFSGVLQQAARTPRRFRYWAVAEPVAGIGHGPMAAFRAHMLLELDEGSGPADPVGTSCRICARTDCPARREPSVLSR